MEQVVDGLLSQLDAELGREDAADVGGMEGTDAILGGRAGLDPRPQAVVLGGIEPRLSAAARAVGEGLGPTVVVAAGPFLDGTLGATQRLGDLGGRKAASSEDDPTKAAVELRGRLPSAEALEFFNGQVWLDVHQGDPPYRPDDDRAHSERLHL